MSRVLSFYIEETGVVKDFAGGTAPSGYLMCFGQAVSRATYKKLFDVIGTAFGAGDGSTTFNVPDCRGRAAVGKDDMGGTAASRLTTSGGGINGAQLGAAGGAESHTLTTAQMPQHNHGVTDPGHTHGHNAAAQYSSGSSGTGGDTVFYLQQAAVINSASTGISIQNSGSGLAHPNVQPGIVFNKIIKT